MIFGALNWVMMAAAVLGLGVARLESMGWGIVFIYILAGSARAVFEGTNKATFADFFPRDKEAAFANVVVFSGGASSIAFLVFPRISYQAMAWSVCAVSALAVPALMRAFSVHNKQKY